MHSKLLAPRIYSCSILHSPSCQKPLNKMKSFSQHTLAVCILVVISYVIDFANVVDSTNKCVVDIRVPSSGNNSGFVAGKCGRFLYGLAKRANQTGTIFLNSAEQNDCLQSINNVDQDANDCGFQKLIDGHGSCSNYSLNDVVVKLGNSFNSLREGCKMLGSSGGSNQYCDQCLKSWEDNISRSSTIRNGSMNAVPDGCDFAVLISVISQRIHDDQWFQVIYNCLGDQSRTEDTTLRTSNVTDDQANHGANEGKHGTDIWIVIGCIAGVLVIVIAAAVTIILRKRTNKFPTGLQVSANSYPGESSSAKISIKEVYSATDNLNESNLIGQGIAGKVYKGILSDGRHVAIKHIINDGQMETFVREVKSLSHIKHPNLVPLLGYCDGEDECFLVYELCHNGNLSQWLFGKEKTLSWIQRLKIATDCARGLSFLHTYPEGCIVHRDIKPTNILISDNFQGRLSDFGLSKVMNMGQSFVSSEVRGTFGYVDPEYQQNHHVNALGDVYSFGMVLLQILSGQKVMNMDAQRPMFLNKLARKLVRGGNMDEFADPKLNGEYSYEAFELVVLLALSCTGLKKQRPPMQRVVAKLEEALDISTRFDSYVPSSIYT